MSWQAKCGSCDGLIVWAETRDGRLMPVDNGSAGKPEGTLAVWRDGAVLRCRVLAADEQPARGEYRAVTHWATCTSASRHRRKKGGGDDALPSAPDRGVD